MAAKAEGFSSGITYLSNAGSLQRVVRQSEEAAPCSRHRQKFLVARQGSKPSQRQLRRLMLNPLSYAPDWAFSGRC